MQFDCSLSNSFLFIICTLKCTLNAQLNKYNADYHFNILNAKYYLAESQISYLFLFWLTSIFTHAGA